MGAQSGKHLSGPERVGEGSIEEGTSELNLDEWIDCMEEILCARVKNGLDWCRIVNSIEGCVCDQ